VISSETKSMLCQTLKTNGDPMVLLRILYILLHGVYYLNPSSYILSDNNMEPFCMRFRYVNIKLTNDYACCLNLLSGHKHNFKWHLGVVLCMRKYLGDRTQVIPNVFLIKIPLRIRVIILCACILCHTHRVVVFVPGLIIENN